MVLKEMCGKIYVDPVRYQGVPENADLLAEPLYSCYVFLKKLGISFERVEHEPAMTIPACVEVEEKLGTPICKNLFLCNRQETEFYLLLLRGDKQFKTKDVSKQIGTARLSFANEEHLKNLLGLTPGSVTVLGLMNDTRNQVRLLIDKDLLEQSKLGCHPCLNTATLAIDMNDFLQVVLPAMGHTFTAVSI